MNKTVFVHIAEDRVYTKFSSLLQTRLLKRAIATKTTSLCCSNCFDVLISCISQLHLVYTRVLYAFNKYRMGQKVIPTGSQQFMPKCLLRRPHTDILETFPHDVASA